MRSDAIVAYMYRADQFCPDHIIEALGLERPTAGGTPLVSVEGQLDIIAANRGVNRADERSYDSDGFPKVIFADQVTSATDEREARQLLRGPDMAMYREQARADVCGICLEPLIN
jgi:hypothetical protein